MAVNHRFLTQLVACKDTEALPIMLFHSLLLLLTVLSTAVAFLVVPPRHASTISLKMSDWGDFAALEDDDDDLIIDNMEYAEENDSQEKKAQVGALLEPPEIEMDAEPMFVPQGSVLELDVDNVLGVLAACREEIGTLFGYRCVLCMLL
jgi:hypothetical protein